MFVGRLMLLTAIWASIATCAGPLEPRKEIRVSYDGLLPRDLGEESMVSLAKAELLPRSAGGSSTLQRRELVKFEIPFPPWAKTEKEKLSFRYGLTMGRCWCKKKWRYMEKTGEPEGALREELPNIWLAECTAEYPLFREDQTGVPPGKGVLLPNWIDSDSWELSFRIATCMCRKEEEHLAGGGTYNEETDADLPKQWFLECISVPVPAPETQPFGREGRYLATGPPFPPLGQTTDGPGKDVFGSVRNAASEALGRFKPKSVEAGTNGRPGVRRPLAGVKPF